MNLRAGVIQAKEPRVLHLSLCGVIVALAGHLVVGYLDR